MRQTRGAVYRPAHLRDTATLLSDFDNTEAETEELVREIQCGHSFSADGMTPPKASPNKIYSL